MQAAHRYPVDRPAGALSVRLIGLGVAALGVLAIQQVVVGASDGGFAALGVLAIVVGLITVLTYGRRTIVIEGQRIGHQHGLRLSGPDWVGAADVIDAVPWLMSDAGDGIRSVMLVAAGGGHGRALSAIIRGRAGPHQLERLAEARRRNPEPLGLLELPLTQMSPSARAEVESAVAALLPADVRGRFLEAAAATRA